MQTIPIRVTAAEELSLCRSWKSTCLSPRRILFPSNRMDVPRRTKGEWVGVWNTRVRSGSVREVGQRAFYTSSLVTYEETPSPYMRLGPLDSSPRHGTCLGILGTASIPRSWERFPSPSSFPGTSPFRWYPHPESMSLMNIHPSWDVP